METIAGSELEVAEEVLSVALEVCKVVGTSEEEEVFCSEVVVAVVSSSVLAELESSLEVEVASLFSEDASSVEVESSLVVESSVDVDSSDLVVEVDCLEVLDLVDDEDEEEASSAESILAPNELQVDSKDWIAASAVSFGQISFKHFSTSDPLEEQTQLMSFKPEHLEAFST